MNAFTKYVLLSLWLMTLSLAGSAQDTLFIRNSTEFIVCTVKSVSESEIVYLKISMPNGPDFKISTERISMIIYSNGEIEYIKVKGASTGQQRPNPMGQQQSSTYYDKGKAVPTTGNFNSGFIAFTAVSGLGSAGQNWAVRNSSVNGPSSILGGFFGVAILIKKESGFVFSIGGQYAFKGYKYSEKVMNSTDFDLDGDGNVDPDVLLDLTLNASLRYIEVPFMFGKMYERSKGNGFLWTLGPSIGVSRGGKYLLEYTISGRAGGRDYRFQGNETVKIKAAPSPDPSLYFDYVNPVDIGFAGMAKYIIEKKVAVGVNFNLGLSNAFPLFVSPPPGYKRGDIIFQNRYIGVTFDVFLSQ